MSKLSYKLIFDRKKTSSDKKKGLLQVRFTKDGKSSYSSTGIRLLKNQWLRSHGLIVKHKKSIELNRTLDKIIESLDKYIDDNPRSLKENLQAHFMDKGGTLFSLIDKVAKSRNFKAANLGKVRNLKLHLNRFGQNQEIFLEGIDKIFVHEFEDYLRNTNKVIGKGKLSRYSISQILKTFQFFCKKAVAFDYIDKDPFRASESIKINKKALKKAPALTNEELKQLENLDVSDKSPSFQIVKDVFLFSCYNFFPFSDLTDFRIKHIFHEKNETIIRKNRVKVKDKQFIQNLEVMPTGQKIKDILVKYIGERKEGLVFEDMPKYQQYRRALIWFSKELGLLKILLTHSGRQTCIKYYKENYPQIPNHVIGVFSCQDEKTVGIYAGDEEKRAANFMREHLTESV